MGHYFDSDYDNDSIEYVSCHNSDCEMPKPHSGRDCKGGVIKCSFCDQYYNPYKRNSHRCPQSTVCNNCKEIGHFAADCPSRACNRCGHIGHLAYQCPQRMTCYGCGSYGHLSRDCPERSSASSAAVKCYNCGCRGHISRDCPNDPGTSTDKGSKEDDSWRTYLQCHMCGNFGHMGSECTYKK